MKTATKSHPNGTVAIYIADKDIRRIARVSILQDISHRAVRHETHAIDVAHRHNPHLSFSVAMHTDGALSQHLLQTTIFVNKICGLQRLQIKYLCAFVERDPQTAELIFADTTARIAP